MLKFVSHLFLLLFLLDMGLVVFGDQSRVWSRVLVGCVFLGFFALQAIGEKYGKLAMAKWLEEKRRGLASEADGKEDA